MWVYAKWKRYVCGYVRLAEPLCVHTHTRDVVALVGLVDCVELDKGTAVVERAEALNIDQALQNARSRRGIVQLGMEDGDEGRESVGLWLGMEWVWEGIRMLSMIYMS
jgi:hypothetical protein